MAAVLAVSCKPDPITPEAPAPEIKVTGATSTITLQAEAVPVTFKVKANYDWTAEVSGTNSDWLDVSPLTGKANEEVTVTVTAENNETKESRTAKITLKIAEKDYSVEITANQLGKEGPDYDTHTKGHVFWSEDFSWITENWPSKLTKYGWISVKVDGTNWNEFQFGASGMEAITAIMEERGLGYDNGANKATYGRYEGYIKLGKTAWVGYVTSPALEGIDEAALATVEVKWDAALYVAANGNAAANAYQKISVVGDGTIVACGTEGATISEDGKTATVPVLYEGEYLWRWVRKSIIVKDATAETKIQFGMSENLDARSFLDNLSVVRVEDEGAVPTADALLPLPELNYEVGVGPEEPVAATAGAGNWAVRANRGWTVESNAEWLKISKVVCNTDGNGVVIAEDKLSATVPATGLAYKVFYDIAANEATEAREAKLTVKVESNVIGEITVKQEAYVAPEGVVTTLAKWSWTGLYTGNENAALAAIATDWVSGDHIIDSDVVEGGVFSVKATDAAAGYSVGTASQKKDRLRIKTLGPDDYFEFKVNGLNMNAGDIIRFKNAAIGVTNAGKCPNKWVIESSFDGTTWTTVAEYEIAKAAEFGSMDVEATATQAISNGTFYVRARCTNTAEEAASRTDICMIVLNVDSDAAISDKDKYYEEDWAHVYFEVEKF